jgi:hypothetical protein
MKQYKNFVENLVKENVILDKRFYIVIPYSYFEGGGIKSISLMPQKQSTGDNLPEIKTSLHSKAEGILSQLSRIGLQTKVVEEDELVALFHQMYNEEAEDQSANSTQQVPKPTGEKI